MFRSRSAKVDPRLDGGKRRNIKKQKNRGMAMRGSKLGKTLSHGLSKALSAEIAKLGAEELWWGVYAGGDSVKVKLGVSEISVSRSDAMRILVLLVFEVLDIVLDIVMCTLLFTTELDFVKDNPIHSGTYIGHVFLTSVASGYTIVTLFMQLKTIYTEVKYGIGITRARIRDDSHTAESTVDQLEEFRLSRATRNLRTATLIVLLAFWEDVITLLLVGYRLLFTDIVFDEDVVTCLQDPKSALASCMNSTQQGVMVQILSSTFFFLHKIHYIRDKRDLKVRIRDSQMEISKSSETLRSELDRFDEECVKKAEICVVVEIRTLLESEMECRYQSPYFLLTDFHILAALRKCKGDPIQTVISLKEWTCWKQENGIRNTRVLATSSKAPPFEYRALRDNFPFVDEGIYNSKTKSLIQYFSLGNLDSFSMLEERLSDQQLKSALRFLIERTQLQWEHYANKLDLLCVVWLVDATDLAACPKSLPLITEYIASLFNLYPFDGKILLWQPQEWLTVKVEEFTTHSHQIFVCTSHDQLLQHIPLGAIPVSIGGWKKFDHREGDASDMLPTQKEILEDEVPTLDWGLTDHPYLSLSTHLKRCAIGLVMNEGVAAKDIAIVSDVLHVLGNVLRKSIDEPDEKLEEYVEKARNVVKAQPKRRSSITPFPALSKKGVEDTEKHIPSSDDESVSGSVRYSSGILFDAPFLLEEKRVVLVGQDSLKNSPQEELSQLSKWCKAWVAQLLLTGEPVEHSINNCLEIYMAQKDCEKNPIHSRRIHFLLHHLRNVAARINMGFPELEEYIQDSNASLASLPMFKATAVEHRSGLDPFFAFEQSGPSIICLVDTCFFLENMLTRTEIRQLVSELLEYYRLLRHKISEKAGYILKVQVILDFHCVRKFKKDEWNGLLGFLKTLAHISSHAFPNLVSFPTIGFSSKKSLSSTMRSYGTYRKKLQKKLKVIFVEQTDIFGKQEWVKKLTNNGSAFSDDSPVFSSLSDAAEQIISPPPTFKAI